MRRCVIAVIATLAFLFAKELRAEPSMVRILRARGADTVVVHVTARLHAEFSAAGFGVDLEETNPADLRDALESNTASFATVAISRVRGGAVLDVWVANHLTGKTLTRRLGEPELGTEGVRILAIRAVELLRASLLELQEPEQGANDEAPPRAPVPPDVAEWMKPKKVPVREPDHWRLDLGGVTTATSGFAPTIGPSGRILRSIANGYAIGLSFFGPTFGPAMHGAGGSADAHQIMALAEAFYVFGKSRLAPTVSLAAGGADTYASGSARAPLLATTQHGFSFAAHGSLGARLAIAEHVGLWIDTGALLVTPPRPIEVLGERVGNQLPVAWISCFGVAASFL